MIDAQAILSVIALLVVMCAGIAALLLLGVWLLWCAVGSREDL